MGLFLIFDIHVETGVAEDEVEVIMALVAVDEAEVVTEVEAEADVVVAEAGTTHMHVTRRKMTTVTEKNTHAGDQGCPQSFWTV